MTPTPTISGPDTDDVCAKCGVATNGEVALVNNSKWCHPCADVKAMAERLRQKGEWSDGGKCWTPDADCQKAADLLDRLSAHPSAGPAEEGLPYGIIDPDYAAFFTVARLVAWSYGYGVGLHGSFTRDLDLILVPWTDHANADPDHVLKNIESRSGWKRLKEEGSKHPHGRLVWTLTSRRFECPRFIDIGFMPTALSAPSGPSVEDIERQTIERCAKVAEKDRRTELAIQYGYEPAFHKCGKHIAKEIRALRSLTQTGEK